jgi:hypothetical protein
MNKSSCSRAPRGPTALWQREQVVQDRQGSLRVVRGELFEVGVRLEHAGHPWNREAEVDGREEVREREQGRVADPRVDRLLCLGYTEVVGGKSLWVTYSSTIWPVAACPFGPALVAVIVPSEKPEIQSPA